MKMQSKSVAFMKSGMASKIVMSSLLLASILEAAVDASASELKVYTIGTSDFEAQMSGLKYWKGDENQRPYKILSGACILDFLAHSKYKILFYERKTFFL
jgi:hypothetical protein